MQSQTVGLFQRSKCRTFHSEKFTVKVFNSCQSALLLLRENIVLNAENLHHDMSVLTVYLL